MDWKETEGGVFECGPYLLAERIDGGWNATALFEFKGEPDPDNTNVTVKLDCPTLADATAAAEKFHRDVTTDLSRNGLLPFNGNTQIVERMLMCGEFKCDYRNWRGKTERRHIVAKHVWHGSTEWHPTPGLMLKGHDVVRGADRDFRIDDFLLDTFEVVSK